MTSYSSMAARGREAALETNTRFRLRKITEIRRVERPMAYSGMTRTWIEYVGECGHVVDSTVDYGSERDRMIGRRKRCHECPIERKEDR